MIDGSVFRRSRLQRMWFENIILISEMILFSPWIGWLTSKKLHFDYPAAHSFLIESHHYSAAGCICVSVLVLIRHGLEG